MKKILLTGSLLLASLSLAGCGMQGGHTMMSYNTLSSEAPGMSAVSQPGMYALYPSDGTNPIVTKELHNGDQYGFIKNSDGKVVAAVVINGQQQIIPLTAHLATDYYWKKQ